MKYFETVLPLKEVQSLIDTMVPNPKEDVGLITFTINNKILIASVNSLLNKVLSDDAAFTERKLSAGSQVELLTSPYLGQGFNNVALLGFTVRNETT